MRTLGLGPIIFRVLFCCSHLARNVWVPTADAGGAQLFGNLTPPPSQPRQLWISRRRERLRLRVLIPSSHCVQISCNSSIVVLILVIFFIPSLVKIDFMNGFGLLWWVFETLSLLTTFVDNIRLCYFMPVYSLRNNMAIKC